MNVNTVDINGNAAVHYAARNDTLLRLIGKEFKANVDVRNNDGDAILHWLCREGRFSLARFLIVECKANANIKDSDGNAPLAHAAAHNHKDICECLVKEGKADVNAKGYHNRTGSTHFVFAAA